MPGWRSDPQQSAVVVVDVQQKLLPVIHQQEQMLKRTKLLCESAALLSVPIYVTEQVPDKLGPTVPELLELDLHTSVSTKETFSSADCLDLDSAGGIQHWVLCGIESHICVRQTALDLVERGQQVTVIGDAVSSRAVQDVQLALDELRSAGVRVIPTESLLFEWLKTCQHPQFRAVSRLVRDA